MESKIKTPGINNLLIFIPVIIIITFITSVNCYAGFSIHNIEAIYQHLTQTEVEEGYAKVGSIYLNINEDADWRLALDFMSDVNWLSSETNLAKVLEIRIPLLTEWDSYKDWYFEGDDSNIYEIEVRLNLLELISIVKNISEENDIKVSDLIMQEYNFYFIVNLGNSEGGS